LMEAMGMELAVAAYDIPGIDQLVTHDETGLLSQFGDTETLIKYWKTLLTNTEVAKRLAKNAHGFVNRKFSAHRMSNEYIDLYQLLV
jgi:glycosyltransferase involved in cell wall biosynthesis